VRLDKSLCAAATALLGGLFPVGSMAVAAAANAELPIYEAAAAAPPVTHLIGSVRVRECRRDSAEARPAALADLRRKAAAMGADGLVNVRVGVEQSTMRYVGKGTPNPCLFETVAKGDAAVLSANAKLAAAPN